MNDVQITKQTVIQLVNRIYYLTGALEALDRRCSALEFENFELRRRMGGGIVPTLFLGMSELEARAAGVLLELTSATRKELAGFLYNADADRDMRRATSIIKSVRERLAPHGIEIQSMRGEGYTMPGGSKAILHLLLEQHHEGNAA
ncbi:MAG: hypothetical protein J0I99_19740 [Devosia sp.]|uniref:hypothetical protein n=1 Tax=Devosia sp. TaxID=1871048 RepID=UPI001ACC2376|nr:hypothetical protein [Devosia sp.]MBN9317979.1 hypothetical protein [Devosia sp.]